MVRLGMSYCTSVLISEDLMTIYLPLDIPGPDPLAQHCGL